MRKNEKDLANRLKEEVEAAEAKKRDEEELQQLDKRGKDASEPLPVMRETNGSVNDVLVYRTKADTKDELLN